LTIETSFLALLAFTLIREIFFLRQVQKLLDRAMSRSYHEYKVAENLGRDKPMRPRVDDDMPEDLGILQGIT
jgi:hypothetical protein